jgi:hypothetical protein
MDEAGEGLLPHSRDSIMASLVMGTVGAVVGSFVPVIGTQMGWAIGSMLGNMLFPPEGPTMQGPRLSDLKVQGSSYGGAVPVVYGSARVAGNVIWSTDIQETRTESEVGGGKGGPTATQVSYTYSVSLAVALADCEIVGVRRIWANKELVFDAGATSVTQIMANDLAARKIAVYTGSESQLPDPTIQADKGVDDTPAYRGVAYVVISDLELEKFGNRTPQFEFEVVRAGNVGTFQNLGILAIPMPAATGYIREPYNPASCGTWESYASVSEGGMYVVRTNEMADYASCFCGTPEIS